MVTIEECSEYNVRAMKSPDFKNKSHGYNFAYSVFLNLWFRVICTLDFLITSFAIQTGTC